MTNVLVLGGTAWLGARIAQRWIEAGARVTCLARATSPAPPGATLVVADRDDPDAYAAVAGEHWDEVVDVSRVPEHVHGAVEVLAGRAAHWTFVSSVSVYAANDDAGADESAALAEPARPGGEYDYARAKVACEQLCRAALADRLAVVRPGLIVGAGDPTDRFGYWVGRFALAGTEPVLVPDTHGRTAQVIDVDDVAAFAVEVGARGWVGTANAVGDVHALGAVLDVAREVAAHSGAVVAASDAVLADHAVQHWAGPRSLPLWLPLDMPGFATRSNRVFIAAGGRLRPLADTLRATLADERTRGLTRDRRAGLTRDDELAVLADIV